MSLWIHFLYDAPEGVEFEEPITSFQGMDLFQFEIEVLGPAGCEAAPFVLEWEREQNEAERRWFEEYEILNLEDIENLEDPSVCGEARWSGPSTPFQPEQARQWALQWIRLLRELPAETRRTVCADSSVELSVANLQALVQQSHCADRHGVTMRIRIG